MRALRFSLALVWGASNLSCGPFTAFWGLDAIKTMKTPADDPALGCGVTLPADSLLGARTSCKFNSGATPSTTLGIDADTVAKIPIRHVIVLMRENRSFDHLLGRLHERGQPNTEAIPADYTNPDAKGVAVAPTPALSTCNPNDPGHQSTSMVAGMNGGAMDGWVRNAAKTTDTDGHFVMEVFDEPQLPFDYFLAKTFALNDRHFAPVASGTFANRTIMLTGQNEGVLDTGLSYVRPNTPSLLHTLMNAGFTWGAYGDDEPFSETFNFRKGDPGTHSLNDFYAALEAGTLPNVAFVDGNVNDDDDHPPADLQKGEAAVKDIYDRLIKSPQWKSSVMFWTYDEGGGFPDHVVPDSTCDAKANKPLLTRGPRVPFVAISPWAKRGFVSHVTQDHSTITRFIELLFGLPALTGRDANASALLDLFDFSCGRDLSVPAAPAAGTGGCIKK